MTIKHRFGKYLIDLRDRGIRYWTIVALLIAIGMLVGDLFGQLNLWVNARYYIYQVLHPNPPTHSKRTILVMIGDEEYWKGELARRVPLKRSYLAKLVRKLDLANPAVIALDIRLDSQTPDKRPVEHPDYERETEDLLRAIKDVSRNTAVVLPKNYTQDGHGKFKPWPTIYEGFDFQKGKIGMGYIFPPYDFRRVPLGLKMENGILLDSFASAIVRLIDEKALEDARVHQEDAIPYGTFIKKERFKQLSSSHVLNVDPETLKSDIAHKVVIIGGDWHEFASGLGPVIDKHLTPAGPIEGAFVHANYVEALLNGQTYRPLGEGLAVVIEVFLSIIIAIIFALVHRLLPKLALVIGLCLFVMILTYFLWQNVGLFFDFFFPVILLASHAMVEQILEWRDAAHKYESIKERKRQ